MRLNILRVFRLLCVDIAGNVEAVIVLLLQIADALEEIPWAVLDACHHLVKAKRVVAGVGPMKSSFRKILQPTEAKSGK
jgi:hypothetical protein